MITLQYIRTPGFSRHSLKTCFICLYLLTNIPVPLLLPFIEQLSFSFASLAAALVPSQTPTVEIIISGLVTALLGTITHVVRGDGFIYL